MFDIFLEGFFYFFLILLCLLFTEEKGHKKNSKRGLKKVRENNKLKNGYMEKKVIWGVGLAMILVVGVCAGGWFVQQTITSIPVEENSILIDEKKETENQEARTGAKECIVSGCSGQLCIEKKNAEDDELATTCEWKEEYGCYRGAVCEIQSDGQCGWKITAEFQTCMQKSKSVIEKDNVSISGTGQEVARETKDTATSQILVAKKLISWGFTKAENRDIDTIILHSSYNSLEGDKYDTDAIINIYKSYGVSPHYIIDREGKIRQLVLEKDIAYHAGVSALPDGRTDVNSASIGIEIVNDDKGDMYTDKQYSAVNALLDDIQKRYKIKYILGHNDIAPGRKTDPWNLDWERVKK